MAKSKKKPVLTIGSSKKMFLKPRKPIKQKWTYLFGGKIAEGKAAMKNLLGGKGANLAEMARLGLPVPPGFTLTTEVCTYFYENKKSYPKNLFEIDIIKGITHIEKITGKKFGDTENPLLVSVRSGARASMPGMMDTILNLGLNDQTVKGLALKTGNERFAWDCYRRFVQMYGDVVLDLKPVNKNSIDPFEAILENKKHQLSIEKDTDLTADNLKDLIAEYKQAIKNKTGKDFPEDVYEQLRGAIGAVFGSWNNDRAIYYRQMEGIPSEWGTACTVQSMVFGNIGDDSGTGVAFTRDPSTGKNIFYGEYLMNAQGEDVVAGTRTPLKIEELRKQNPVIYSELEAVRLKLEKHYKDMLDIEFTIENGKLYMLQCRVGKRTGFAAIKIAIDLVDEKVISIKEALLRIEPESLNQLLRPVFNKRDVLQSIFLANLLTKGLNAGPGAASGQVYFNALDAEEAAARGERVILVRIETSPEDIKGMAVAEGILTARGGMTSHAALVARQMGKVCVVGCEDLVINYESSTLRAKGHPALIKEGDYISIDGSTGEVFLGEIKTSPSEVIQVLIDKTLKPEDAPVYQMFQTIMDWSNQKRQLKIRTNADQPDQVKNALAFGAEGIGLCRTEHMFFGGDRIDAVREMILAENMEARRIALAKIEPYQAQDFFEIFLALNGLPATIRLIDPPLHEFLPHKESEQKDLAVKLGLSFETVQTRVNSLYEFNPMLGFRGDRLGIVYPEITAMQTRAIMKAAVQSVFLGQAPKIEIMVPFIGTKKELDIQKATILAAAKEVLDEYQVELDFQVGTMIEIPRAALQAKEIAQSADFFSFGTNDLTQMTLGLSRDDSGKFLPTFVEKEIYSRDPFVSLDQTGVGELVTIGVERGRKTKPNLKIGVCGEHGGDPESVEFFHRVGLNYVSCSPFRVPIAILAAARAAIRDEKQSS